MSIVHPATTWSADAAAAMLERRLAVDGTATHRHVAAIASGNTSDGRDLADAVHHLALLHCRQPGLVDGALLHTHLDVARRWLAQAADRFAVERACLARIVVAAGPLPSTPGQADTEGAVTTLRHALDTLGRSDRTGCAMGAACALLLDWPAIRRVLDAAATRFGVERAPCVLPDAAQLLVDLDAAATTLATRRAVAFGADQTLTQHRLLFDLLARRSAARD